MRLRRRSAHAPVKTPRAIISTMAPATYRKSATPVKRTTIETTFPAVVVGRVSSPVSVVVTTLR